MGECVGIYETNTTPAVGAVAVQTSGTFGHVAFITGVRGSTITIAEYNHGENGTYDTRSGTLSGLGFNKVTHFEQYESGGAGSSGGLLAPSAVVDSYNGTGRNIFYVGANQQIYQWSVQSGAWSNTYLGGGSGEPVAAGTSPSAVVDSYNGTGRNIFYVGADQRIHQWYVSNNQWVNTDLAGEAVG